MLYTIEELKADVGAWSEEMPKGKLICCDFTNAQDIRDSLEMRGFDAAGISNNELVEMFNKEYEYQLRDAYSFAIDELKTAIENRETED